MRTSFCNRTFTTERRDDVRPVTLKVQEGCLLGVSIYPNFRYNAVGGGGKGTAMLMKDAKNGSSYSIHFDAEKLCIPPLNTSTTTILGIPLPPFLSISIRPMALEGSVDVNTGQVQLDFDAEFQFRMGTWYTPPALRVTTVLTTEDSMGLMRKGSGERIDQEGRCKLAGVARVPKVSEWFLDGFLMLPTDALAELEAELLFE